MDFAIEIIDGLSGAMTFDQVEDLRNNVFLSLAVEKGSWFHHPGFGLRPRPRLKNTEASARLVRQDYLEALQWLKDTGRATAIEVSTERDRSQDMNRLKILAEVTQADGRKVTFETFKEVV